MAKVEDLKVRFSNLPDFTKEEFNVVKWLINVLEDKFTLTFETVVDENKKDDFIYQVDHLFNGIELLINSSEAQSCRKALDELEDEISSAKHFLKETEDFSNFFWERITTKWYVLRRKRTKFLIARILAMYISEHPEISIKDVRKKTVNILKNRIVDIFDMAEKYHIIEVKAAIPEKWPTTTNTYFTTAEVPYLEWMIQEAKLSGYTQQAILDAWDSMLNMKSQQANYPEEYWMIPLDEALYVLFYDLSYNETKKHYTALLSLAEKNF